MTVILRSYSDVKNICFTVFCIRSWDVINILTCPWALTLVQHPLITAERAVEPHGVVERGGELGPVLWVRQQHCAQQSKVWHISSNAAVQLHVTFPYANTQQKQFSMYHTSYSDLKHEAGWQWYFTNMSSCSPPKQPSWLLWTQSVKVCWVDWFYLNGDFISQQFFQAFLCLLCQVRFTAKQPTDREKTQLYVCFIYSNCSSLVMHNSSVSKTVVLNNNNKFYIFWCLWTSRFFTSKIKC